jgi:hypothetical protein
MATRRFPKAGYERKLALIERDLRNWAMKYGEACDFVGPEWLRQRYADRETQLLDVAHTVERARYDLGVLPRLK